ncbi:proline--tRNA ligase, partial [Candidatus Aerophobetes bacterium]|nr:proline--tRNA ligase [Candidatus Aerophobetes bacterium]
VIDKIILIIREEMKKIGAQELLMPFVQPAYLWEKSGRLKEYGEELLRFKDRRGASFVLSPTHEEMITEIAGEILTSYKRLPALVYQIQIKFRDELRPRGGVIRAREFLMKDAYSFCENEKQMEEIYRDMQKAYGRIFSRCGLVCRMVEAESGPIGGDVSHEFIAPASAGEDRIVECERCGYSSKFEKAVSLPEDEEEKNERMLPLEEIDTPNLKSIEELSSFLGLPGKKFLKTVLFKTEKGYVAAVVRGDHQVNQEKLKKLIGVSVLEFASSEALEKECEVEVGFLGPVGENGMTFVVDRAVMQGKNFVAGAGKKDKHFINVNPGRDFNPQVLGDIRFVAPGDRCCFCRSPLQIKKGIEVGHLFKLGYKYSSSLQAFFLNQSGEKTPFLMGCYGIGVSRLPAAIIEQNHDEEGIIWPEEVAPFDAIIIPAGEGTFSFSQKLYEKLKDEFDVLFDDRDISPGAKFKDCDLIGIPLKIIVGRTFLKEGKIEIKRRKDGYITKVDQKDFSQRLRELIKYGKQ